MATIPETFAELREGVSAEITVEQSAITLLNGISAQLAAALAIADPADALVAAAEVQSTIQVMTAELAGAVGANIVTPE